MKIRWLIAIPCAAGVLILFSILATRVFTGAPEEKGQQDKSPPSIAKYSTEPTQTDWPFSVKSQSYSATTTFKILAHPAPDLFAVEKDQSATVSPGWMDLQVKSLTTPAVLDPVIQKLNLAGGWKMTPAAAAAKLREITKVSREKETDVVAVTVTYSDSAQAAEIANAVRDAYAARRASLEEERTRRLFQNTEARISELEKAESTKEEKTIPKYREYASSVRTYESQLALLKRLKEQNMRLSAGPVVVRKPVEILEVAMPAPGN